MHAGAVCSGLCGGLAGGAGRRLDALIVPTVPGVRKAFFRDTSLRPVPPGKSKHKEVRYLDLREDDSLDEAQMATWIRQAAALPGWVP